MSSMRTVGDAPSVSGVSNLNRTLSAPASPDERGKLNGRQLPPDPRAEPVSATTMEYVSPPSIDARTRSAFCGNVLVRRARYLSSPLFSRLRLITAVSACPATLPFDSRLFRPEPLDSVAYVIVHPSPIIQPPKSSTEAAESKSSIHTTASVD